jgi:predicted small lipoprotein YifL
MRSTTTILLALACTLAACGDSAGPVDSGLPPEKVGKELTADEEEKLCVAAAENLAAQNTDAERKNFACVLLGVGLGSPESCEQLAEMCRNGAGEDGGEDDGGTQMCMLRFDIDACDAKISDIEACITEQNETLGRAIREASCDDVGKTPSEPVVGPACSKIKTNCPGIA